MSSLQQIWLAIGEMYGKRPEVAAVMAKLSEAEGLTASQVLSAWREWMKRQGSSTMPTVGDLLAILRPETSASPRQLATQLAAMIPILIHRHGQYWRQGSWFVDGPRWLGNHGQWFSSFDEAIQSYLGSLSSLIAERWENIAETWGENETANLAQMRDLFEAHLSDQALRTEAQALLARTQNLIQQKTGNKSLLPDKQQKEEV